MAELIPFAVETFGCLGDHAADLLRRIAPEGASWSRRDDLDCSIPSTVGDFTELGKMSAFMFTAVGWPSASVEQAGLQLQKEFWHNVAGAAGKPGLALCLPGIMYF